MAATYTGLVPDTFKDGAEVVAKGTLTPENGLNVIPDGIMAKCPSIARTPPARKLDQGGVAQKL